MTHRQFAAWSAWLDLQWNRPNRTDHYLMQIAEMVYHSVPRTHTPTPPTFEIKFVPKSQSSPQGITPEMKAEMIRRSQAAWRSAKTVHRRKK